MSDMVTLLSEPIGGRAFHLEVSRLSRMLVRAESPHERDRLSLAITRAEAIASRGECVRALAVLGGMRPLEAPPAEPYAGEDAEIRAALGVLRGRIATAPGGPNRSHAANLYQAACFEFTNRRPFAAMALIIEAGERLDDSGQEA